MSRRFGYHGQPFPREACSHISRDSLFFAIQREVLSVLLLETQEYLNIHSLVSRLGYRYSESRMKMRRCETGAILFGLESTTFIEIDFLYTVFSSTSIRKL